jgi:hypothetical protein
MVPGNHNFDKCIEFSDPYRIFWGPTAYKVTQILFFLCAVCMNVAAIIDTAEVVDSVLGLHSNSYAVSVDRGMKFQAWSHAAGPCTRSQAKLGQCDPFADTTVYGEDLLTLGYVLTAAVFLPICLKDLKENTGWQIFGFGILMTLSMYFCYSFWDSGQLSLHHASLWGHEWSNMLGVIMFNFALVLAIPAWLHEKKESVSAVSTVIYSTAISTALYIGVGALGGLTISHVNVNLLTPMVSGAYGQGVQIAASIFAFFIIGLDIPLFSVLTRYNLTHSGLCTTRTANLLVVWIPWGLAWIFYQGDAIGELLDWSGTLLTSAVAFILPLYLALRALAMDPEELRQGSVSVYRRKFMESRKSQIMSLYVLLFLAVAAVMVAIGGQLLATEEKEAYLHSIAYINATDAATYAVAITHRYLKGTTSLAD